MPRICTSFSTAWRAASAGVECRGDHLLAAIMAVLPDLGHQDARPAAFVLLEPGHQLFHPLDPVGHADLPLVDAGDRLDLRAMAPEHLLERQ